MCVKLPGERTPTTGQRPCTVTSDRTTSGVTKEPQNCLYTQNRCSQRGTARVSSSRGNQPGGCDTKFPGGKNAQCHSGGNTRIHQVEWYRSCGNNQGRLPEGRPLLNDVNTSTGPRGTACNEGPANSPSSSSDLEGPSRGS